MEKECSKCGVLKRIDGFGKNRNYKSGISAVCKLCRNIEARKRWILMDRDKKENIKRLIVMGARNRSKKKRVYNETEKLRKRYYKRMRKLLKGGSHIYSEFLGCAPSLFLSYIESLFEPDMSWSNYGKLWNYDHIKPVSTFDLTDWEQVKQCFHYSNTRPLYCDENSRKYNKPAKSGPRINCF